MTKLPQGFTHELRHHLTSKAPDVDPLTGAPVLPLEEFCCGSYQHLFAADDSITEITSVVCPAGAHGFSALIVRALTLGRLTIYNNCTPGNT